MKAISYRLSLQALEDLKSIWKYTKHKWSEAQAEKYTNNLIDRLENLDDKKSKTINTQFGTYFLTNSEKHYIIFKWIDDEIYFVVRILHQQMDIKRHIKNLLD